MTLFFAAIHQLRCVAAVPGNIAAPPTPQHLTRQRRQHGFFVEGKDDVAWRIIPKYGEKINSKKFTAISSDVWQQISAVRGHH